MLGPRQRSTREYLWMGQTPTYLDSPSQTLERLTLPLKMPSSQTWPCHCVSLLFLLRLYKRIADLLAASCPPSWKDVEKTWPGKCQWAVQLSWKLSRTIVLTSNSFIYRCCFHYPVYFIRAVHSTWSPGGFFFLEFAFLFSLVVANNTMGGIQIDDYEETIKVRTAFCMNYLR